MWPDMEKTAGFRPGHIRCNPTWKQRQHFIAIYEDVRTKGGGVQRKRTSAVYGITRRLLKLARLYRRTVFNTRLTMLEHAKAIPSVRPSIRHTRDPRLNSSVYRNTFCTIVS